MLSLRFHPLVLYSVVILFLEAGTYLAARVSGRRQIYLGHEKFFLYVAAGIVAANFVVKNYFLIRYGIDLLEVP